MFQSTFDCEWKYLILRAFTDRQITDHPDALDSGFHVEAPTPNASVDQGHPPMAGQQVLLKLKKCSGTAQELKVLTQIPNLIEHPPDVPEVF